MKTLIKAILCGFLALVLFSCNSSETNVPNDSKPRIDSNDTSKGPSAQAIADEAQKQQKNFVPLELNKVSETQWVCAGQLPQGWLKIGGQWNPTTCGNPTSIYENVWLIERYSNKPVGSVMTVCAQQIPSGWVKIGGSWNPTTCGSPSTIRENVIQIKRLN